MTPRLIAIYQKSPVSFPTAELRAKLGALRFVFAWWNGILLKAPVTCEERSGVSGKITVVFFQ